MKLEPMAQEALALRAAGASNVVRVALPVEVAFNLSRFQKVQAEIFERLGHPQCVSGWDVRFDILRNYAVDAKGTIREVGFGL